MDFQDSTIQKPKYLTRKRVSTDGTVTIEYKLKPKKIRKIVVARGSKNTTGSHSVGAVITSQLIPFRKSMISQLNKRGFNTSKMDWNNIVALYYNEFVSNKYNKQSPFTPVNTYEFCNNLAFKVHPKDHLTGDIRDFRNAEGMGQIGNITDNIINTYKFSRAKYKRAIADGMHPQDVLSDVELRQAKAAMIVEKRLTDRLEGNRNVKVGSLRKIIIWVLIGFVIYKLLV